MIVKYRKLLERALTVLGSLPTRSVDSVCLERDITDVFADTYICPDCEEPNTEPFQWGDEHTRTQRSCAVCGRTWTVIEKE